MTSPLWMRWLDFRRLRDLLGIVGGTDCQLRAKDLTKRGIEKRILVGEDGSPFKPTTVYHYRRTLERLGAVRVVNNRYCLARDNPAAMDLASTTGVGVPLTNEERRAFASLVLNNTDCYENFLRAFLPSSEEPPSEIDRFIEVGTPVLLLPPEKLYGTTMVRLKNLEVNTELSLSGEGASQAILWGMKPWCVDQLCFVDEVFSVGLGYVLYPRHIEVPWNHETIAQKLVGVLDFASEWTTVRVEELILKAARKWKLPSQSTRDAVLWLIQRFADRIAAIPTSEEFILTGLHPTQRRAALNSYVRLPNGELISHLRAHSSVLQAVSSRRSV